jgi:hypothetical protein
MTKWRTIQEVSICTVIVAAVVAPMIYLIIQIAEMPDILPEAPTAQYGANMRHEAARRYVISSRGEPESCNVCKK